MSNMEKMELHQPEELLQPGERLDDLCCGGFRIIQDPENFCFGMDAVLLANFTEKTDGRIIDLGTGNGVIPLLLCAKGRGRDYTGLELMPGPYDRARRSVILNGAEDSITMLQGDIRKVKELFSPGAFQTVVSNPPYISGGSGLMNANREKCVARHEIEVTLPEICRAAAYLLPEKGSFCMVHKPFRLPEIFRLLGENGLEPKRMRLVQPKKDKAPNMVLIAAVKGAGPELRVLPALVIYDEEGQYTPEAKASYGG